MAVNLPNVLLRTFVSVVETGSMVRASQQVFLSQSAISFQIKKLEGLVKRPLFQRNGKQILLTADGKLLYEYARKILGLHDEALSAINNHSLSGPVKIGLVQDFSDSFLRSVLAKFAAEHPNAQVYVKITRTVHLKHLISQGELDIAVGIANVGDDAVVAVKPVCWFGREALIDSPVIPLALLEAPCKFRDAAISGFEQAGLSYRIAVEAPNLSALHAAVDAGLGVTCRTPLFGPEMPQAIRRKLPALPRIGLSLYKTEDMLPAAHHLKTVAMEALQGI